MVKICYFPYSKTGKIEFRQVQAIPLLEEHLCLSSTITLTWRNLSTETNPHIIKYDAFKHMSSLILGEAFLFQCDENGNPEDIDDDILDKLEAIWIEDTKNRDWSFDLK